MENIDNIQHKLLDYGLKAVVVAGTVYGISKLIKHYQKNNTENQVEKNPEVSQAMTIYSAMNPSGMEWMRKMDGTNTHAFHPQEWAARSAPVRIFCLWRQRP